MTLLSVLASGGSVVDLDGTFFIQLAIFLTVWIVLARVYFRPTLKALDARHEGTQGRFEQARRLENEADQWAAIVDARFSEARAAASTARTGVIVEAEKRERETFEASERAARGKVEEARTRIQGQVEAARKELRPRAQELAAEIAGKVLGRKVA